jgi:hypothetical protein
MTWRWACAVLAACGGSSGPSAPPPELYYLTLSTDELRLTAPVGVTVTASLTATNANDVSTPSLTRLGDSAPPEFALHGTDCPEALAPGASCTITIDFTPDRIGELRADSALEVGNGFAPLTGNGEVAVTISPTIQDFGSIYIDVDSAPVFFTIQNTTAVAQKVTTRLDANQDWGFELTGSTCGTIPPMGSCSASVVLKGGTSGARSATLDVGGADAALTGNVLTIASPQLGSEGTGYFGDVGRYADPVGFLIGIFNGTHMDLPQIDVEIAGADSAAFAIIQNGCTNPVPDGELCYLEVRAHPTGLGMVSAMLTAQTPGIPVYSVPLTANFVDDGPPLALAPSGVVAFAPDQQITFTLTNSGQYQGIVYSVTVDAPYQVSTNTCIGNVITPGSGTCTFAIQLVGTSSGDAHQLLTIVWNDWQQDTVMLVPAN